MNLYPIILPLLLQANAVLPPPAAGAATGWLHVEGNHIVNADGTPWMGRGANIQDTRSCWACEQADVDEVKRRLRVLIEDWGANLVRLTMESHDAHKNILADPSYRRDVVELVRFIGTFPGTYVILALWHDPSLGREDGFPSAAGHAIWQALVDDFHDAPQVIFGISNEPTGHHGERDAEVHARMSATVRAIRGAERRHGSRRHLVAVQGTWDFARHLAYYVDHPVTAGGRRYIVYETHLYDREKDFDALLTQPAAHLPVVLGEFGPRPDIDMTLEDCSAVIALAERLKVPWAGWTFHQQCPPNLIEKTSTDRCGVGMPIVATKGWGELLRSHLRPAAGTPSAP